MIVYVNGDSHSAAAEATNPHCFAEDDELYWNMGRRPHPENERVSYGCEIANAIFAVLVCDAEAASSNTRIIRTTKDWIAANNTRLDDTFFIIQWSTWERQEWLIDNVYYQVNSSGIDHVPEHMVEQYKQFVVNVDWHQCETQSHQSIWEFHSELMDLGVKHVMFNGNNHFERVNQKHNWRGHYLDPYDQSMTYDSVLRKNGFKTVNPDSWHFGAEAHCFWGKYLLQYCMDNNLVKL